MTPEQIKALAAAGHLDPVGTHVWCEGMEDWKTLAESGLLSGAASLPAPQVPAPVAGRRYLASELINDGTGREIRYPGYGRLRYFLTNLGITVVFYAILAVMFFAVFNSSGGQGAGTGFVLGFVLLSGIMMVVSLYVAYQRVKNLGMSGWALLWTLVPFMNLWIGWRMFACPAGYDAHRTLDTPAKVISGIVVGLFALGIVANIVAAMMQV